MFGQAQGERVLEQVKGSGSLTGGGGPDADGVGKVGEPVSGREGCVFLSSRGTVGEVDEIIEAFLGAKAEEVTGSSWEQTVGNVPPVKCAEEQKLEFVLISGGGRGD